ncbi:MULTISPECIES: ATP-binding protein [Halobacterium]|uniref:sensor histidine kinase n=1 Tax=Halobacterium TaxID=2239 RepID=UPI001966534E|nr:MULTISPECIES: ATP-binding protein [Halobacterium]MDL0121831.1 ATP-binding protein [Halobacterium salinarum]QRY25698.1 HAMP domain-containing protein [Halobacterium sp. BOL4-2]
MSHTQPTTTSDVLHRFWRRYESFIWWTMDAVGVASSVRAKILLAVTIQFAVSLAQVVVPVYFSGPARITAVGVLVVGATLALVNTVLVVERDIVDPVTGLQAAATHIAEGDLAAGDPPRADGQQDEIGALVDDFAAMHSHLRVVAAQAEALADHDFDAAVLETSLPGRFGASLRRMTASLDRYIDRITADRERSTLLNYLVSHDVPNVVNVLSGRLQLARRQTDAQAVRDHLDVADRQVSKVEEVCDVVGKLTRDDGAAAIDVVTLLDSEVARVTESYPDAQVSADLPSPPCRVRGNELLNSVFRNLITNAVEHNDAPTPRVTVSVAVEAESVTVRVADNGPGLDVSDSESFFQHRPVGTGLNIVHTAVRTFGGTVTVADSDLGGTAFEVALPRDAESPSRTVRRPVDPPTVSD